MLEKYIYCGTKKMRCGITTGSCAAAASKAAAIMLLTGKITEKISIITPKGIEITAEILCAEIGDDYASCAVRKDGGDDPDITNGLLIFSKVSRKDSGFTIRGGRGVGIVTKPGLDQPVGEHAINSVPRRMIKEAVLDAAEGFCCECGFEVEISVPDGEETAKKTFNPRMGIEGGISIIGTSGIVEPMSNAALVETIRTEMRMRKAEGYSRLLLTLGNYSNNYIERELHFPLEKSVLCSNFIGDAIDSAVQNGFESVLIVGHLGKLVKLGAGIMNTHSSNADGRMDVLVTCGLLAGAEISQLKRVTECVTVDAALDIFDETGITQSVLEILVKRAEKYLQARVKGSIEIGAVMFSDKHMITVKTPSAEKLIEKTAREYLQ